MVLLCRYGMNFFKMSNTALFKWTKGVKLRQYSQQATTTNDVFTPFMKMIESRRAQASRSILVQVQSPQSFKQLFTYCESLGRIENMFHYSEGPEPMHFIIVEFASESDVKNVLEASTHIQESQTIPTTSQFLWFRAAAKKLGKLKASKVAKLSSENGTHIMNETELKVALAQCDTISEQIQKLYDLTCLNDVGQRLRFLTAKQIENTISGMFPDIVAFPFGSSVNGFGKMGCDLDLVVRFTQREENEDSRLVFHCKAALGSERSTSQRNMEIMSDLINLFLPGCAQVRRILQARVPIIKYHQQLTNVECDLSMSNMSGVYMSDFLYLMGEIDSRVRPLVFVIRKWAKEMLLTNSSPGRWISNFSLTLLVLAFLQKPLQSPPVLPTLNQLTAAAEASDQYVTEDGINGTFLRDISRLNFKKQNQSSLETLLMEFFEFYAQFDFANKAICLNEAASISKPEHSPLYIVNPLERGLNVSKNMSLEEVERFKIEVRNAAWLLESRNDRMENKGLAGLFENKHVIQSKINFTLSQRQSRLMEISTLFKEENEENIVYKNPTIEKAVENIKKETEKKIRSLTRQKSGR